jgi:hypothetical protein
VLPTLFYGSAGHDLLEEVELWYVVEDVILPTNSKELIKHNRKSIKAKRIILDLVKDHLILHIIEKKTTREMHIALVTLYWDENMSR